MDPNKTTTSEFERRSSMRHSRRISGQRGDGEMEEEDVNYEAMAMADGFRPPEPAQNARSTASAVDNRPYATTPPKGPESTDTTDARTRQPRKSLGQRPSSISKPPRPGHDSMSIQQHWNWGMTRVVESRASSASTDSQAFLHREGPYQGPSGPSHPYGVYTQNAGLTRTLSIATTSTAPMPESSFVNVPGSTHPYGMYSQGTIDELAADPVSIPVGFAGRADQYQRRLGPDGEEIADIIGPDGHTEQLPPYSREPPSSSPYGSEAAARKAREVAGSASTVHPAPGQVVGAAVVASAAAGTITTSASAALPPPMSGAGGLGLATRNPEFEGTDEPGSPHSRHSARSFITEESQHNINTVAADVALSEKAKPSTRWQAWGKRKCCRVVPYWALILAITVVVLSAGIVIGGVVGTRMRNLHKYPPPRKGDSKGTSYSTVTVTYDATAVPIPTDLPELVTGSFSLPLLASRVTNTCFNDTTLAQAWNCNVALVTEALMTIEEAGHHSSAEDDSGYKISITCNESVSIANNVYAWGSQPALIPEPMQMELVNDNFQPGRGPAWFKMVSFNKTIVLPEPVLTASPSTATGSARRLAREMLAYSGGGDLKRKGIAQTGDKAWICTWPDTFLEVFIYPMQNSSWAKPYGSGNSGTWPSATPGPSVTTTSSPGPNATPASSLAKDGHLAGRSQGQGHSGSHWSTPDVSPTATTPTDPSMSMPMPTPSGNGTWEMPPPLYPRVVKIEERRVTDSPMPSCQLVVIQGDGQPPVPVKDDDGDDTIIWIVENEPPPPVSGSKNVMQNYDDGVPHYRSEASDISDCGCIWFVT